MQNNHCHLVTTQLQLINIIIITRYAREVVKILYLVHEVAEREHPTALGYQWSVLISLCQGKN